MSRFITTLIVWLGFIMMAPVHAQQTPQKFIQETNYLLYLPDEYAQDSTKRWPLLLFLHGSGERGVDLNKVKTHGPPKLAAQGKKFPFLVVSPQAVPNGGWQAETLYQLLGSIKKQYRVDADRIWLTGLSMGGYGTWDLAMKHPEEFAAIVPICGGGDTTDAWKLRHLKIWGFHGAKDLSVPLRAGQEMIDAAKKYNPSVQFTIYPEAGHDSWTSTYDNDSLYQWLLAQKKFTFREIKISPPALEAYAGRFTNSFKDTVKLFVKEGKLLAETGRNDTIDLKPAADNLFFIDPHNNALDLLFVRNNKGLVNGFIFRGNKQILFRRIK